MHYFGGKVRIAKPLSAFLQSQISSQPFVDLFCGACNVVSNISASKRIANDINPYLISIFQELQKGWIPPDFVSEELYRDVRDNKDKYENYFVGFVGFACSFAGKFFGGYARDAINRNYCLNAKNSILKKISKLHDVTFYNLDYQSVPIESGSVVYCDIPYKNTTPYIYKFDYDRFYSWVEDNKSNYTIFISEYEVNKVYPVVLSLQSKTDVGDKSNNKIPTVEIVMKAE